MTATVVALIAVSALGWTAFDALRKSVGRRVPPTAAVAALMLLQAPLFAVWALASADALPAADWWAPAVPLALLNIVSNVLFLRAITTSPLSLTIPFLALTPVFTALLGLAAGDIPSGLQWVGAAAVVAGALVLNGDARQGPGLRALARAAVSEPGSLLMIGVAAMWSLAVVLDRVCLRHAAPSVHGTLQLLAIGGALLIWVVLRGRGGDLKQAARAWPWILGAAAVAALALAPQLLALDQTLPGNVEAIKRAIGLAGAVVIGRLAFDEAVTTWRVAGVAVMTAGTVAVILG